MKIKKLRNGLTIEKIKRKYPWILEAEIEDAIIGENFDGLAWYLIWYDGVWKSGLWFDGRWNGGIWEDGEWLYGIWEDGEWYGGIWEGGYDRDGNYHKSGDSPDKWEE